MFGMKEALGVLRIISKNVKKGDNMEVAMYEEQLIQHLLRYAADTNSDVHIGTGVWREFLQALVSGSDSKVEKLYRDKFSSLYKLPVFGIKTVFIKWIKYFVEGTDGLPLNTDGLISNFLYKKEKRLHFFVEILVDYIWIQEI